MATALPRALCEPTPPFVPLRGSTSRTILGRLSKNIVRCTRTVRTFSPCPCKRGGGGTIIHCDLQGKSAHFWQRKESSSAATRLDFPMCALGLLVALVVQPALKENLEKQCGRITHLFTHLFIPRVAVVVCGSVWGYFSLTTMPETCNTPKGGALARRARAGHLF